MVPVYKAAHSLMKYIDQLAGKAGIAGREKGWAINDEKKGVLTKERLLSLQGPSLRPSRSTVSPSRRRRVYRNNLQLTSFSTAL